GRGAAGAGGCGFCPGSGARGGAAGFGRGAPGTGRTTGKPATGIVRCCWKRWWTHSAFEELATGPPTGSTLGRPPVADEWTESTKPTVKPSKISTCTRWSAMPGNAYAASSSGKQIPWILTNGWSG